MGRKGIKDKRTRDDVISLARQGEVTPEQAEAEAKRNNWPPFEQQPALPEFDPMRESRWSMAMAVAWIAWRDLQLVRGQYPDFRTNATHWMHRRWNQPKGNSFVARAGWF